MADGAASISASMLVAVLINVAPSLVGVWGLASLQELTNKQDGMIVVATLLLLPTSFAVYGVSQVIFAAKEAVERRAMEKGQKVGLEEGRREERERIAQALEQHGVEISPEVARMLNVARESEPGSHHARKRPLFPALANLLKSVRNWPRNQQCHRQRPQAPRQLRAHTAGSGRA